MLPVFVVVRCRDIIRPVGAEQQKKRGHSLLQEDEMVRRAIAALMESLGPVETARFLTLPHSRRINSVLRHRKWQASLDKERFFDQVFGKASRS